MMRKIAVLAILFATMSLTLFAQKAPKDMKKLQGTWKLVEYKQTKYSPGLKHEVIRKTGNSNIKEYKLEGLTFQSYNTKKQPLLHGQWTIGDGKLIEEVSNDAESPLRGVLNAYEYKLKKNKLVIKYNASARNDAFVTETWERVKQ